MDRLHAIMMYVLLGLPIWAWTLLFTVGALNEVIQRSKWTEAQSAWQGFWRFLLWVPAFGPVLARFPFLGPVVRRFAGLKDEGLAVPPAVALLPLAFLVCAGCGLKAAYASLNGAEKIVGTATDSLPAFDKAHRDAIVAAATSREDGQKKLAAWDETSERLVKAVEGTHASVKLAKDGIRDVAAGVRSKAELSKWIIPVLRAADNLRGLLSSVGLNLEVR